VTPLKPATGASQLRYCACIGRQNPDSDGDQQITNKPINILSITENVANTCSTPNYKIATKMSMNESDCTVLRDGFPRPFPNTPTNVLEQFKMTGKVVVVTGGADGIGYAVAEGMAEANAHVVLWYNS
jgi:hypothetical protein